MDEHGNEIETNGNYERTDGEGMYYFPGVGYVNNGFSSVDFRVYSDHDTDAVFDAGIDENVAEEWTEKEV